MKYGKDSNIIFVNSQNVGDQKQLPQIIIMWPIDLFLSNGSVNMFPRKTTRTTIEGRCILCGQSGDHC
jgi:hypothetical protein